MKLPCSYKPAIHLLPHVGTAQVAKGRVHQLSFQTRTGSRRKDRTFTVKAAVGTGTQGKKVDKVVLAYSGGLDTSVILTWLQETYDCEVVTFTADLGQVSNSLYFLDQHHYTEGQTPAKVLKKPGLDSYSRSIHHVLYSSC